MPSIQLSQSVGQNTEFTFPCVADTEEVHYEETIASKPQPKKRSPLPMIIASGVGFLADAYDLFVIDSVMEILRATAAKPQSSTDRSLVVTATILGAVLGQLGFGVAADFIGRKAMFISTSLLVIFGSISSASVGINYTTSTPAFSVYYQLAICRFLLGLGIGGEYPLSATVSSEVEEEEEVAQENGIKIPIWRLAYWRFITRKPNSVALVFSMQGVGMILSCVVVIFFIAVGVSLEATWRLCLSLGAIPSAVAFYYRWQMSEAASYKLSKREFFSGESTTDVSTALFESKPVSSSSSMSEILISPRRGKSFVVIHNELCESVDSDQLINELYFHPSGFTNMKDEKNINTELTDIKSSSLQPFPSDSWGHVSQEHKIVTLNNEQLSQEHTTILHTSTTHQKQPKRRAICSPEFLKHIKRTLSVLARFRYILFGTAMSWFLIDVTLYGIGTYKINLVESIFKDTESASLLSKLNKEQPQQDKRQLSHTDDVIYSNSKIPNNFNYANLESLNYIDDLMISLNNSFNNKLQLIGRQLQNDDIYTQQTVLNKKDTIQQTKDSVLQKTKRGTLLAFMAFPGYVLSVLFIHKCGLKRLQLFGFYSVAFVFILLGLGIHFQWFKPSHQLWFVGLTFLFSNFGANTTTFILPTHLYPSFVRATCHGFSAAMGKAGGVVGGFIVKPLEQHLGLPWLFIIFGLVSLSGALITHLFIPTDAKAKYILQQDFTEMVGPINRQPKPPQSEQHFIFEKNSVVPAHSAL